MWLGLARKPTGGHFLVLHLNLLNCTTIFHVSCALCAPSYERLVRRQVLDVAHIDLALFLYFARLSSFFFDRTWW